MVDLQRHTARGHRRPVERVGSAVLRGGFRLFYERTPSAAGRSTFERARHAIRVRRRHAAWSGGAVRASHDARPRDAAQPDVGPRLRPPAEFDGSLHFGVINRQGVTADSRSVHRVERGAEPVEHRPIEYREAEAGIHFTHGPGFDLNSRTRVRHRGDLNAFTNYFDTVLWPVVGANAYGPSAADAPHRLFARGRAMPNPRWLLLGIADWRSGLPYSAVNETLDFIGPRNQLRFPTYARLELGVEHRFKVLKLQPWIGVRAYNALSAFLPTDVQANAGSPFFGSFYNPRRQFRLGSASSASPSAK